MWSEGTENSKPKEGGQIIHICSRQAWRGAQKTGEYRAASLEMEGFIHCSNPEQVLEVANRYYRGVPDLVLLWIEPGSVTAPVRWENNEGSEKYPHIYGGINMDAVRAVTDFFPNSDGIFINLPQV